MIVTVRKLPVLLLLIAPATITEADVCAQPYTDVVLPAGVSTIGLISISLNADQESSLQGAAAQWNSCGGGVAGFSTSGSGDLDIHIEYKAQAASFDCGGNTATCGCFDWQLQFNSELGKNVIVGGTVKIFANNGDGSFCDYGLSGLEAIMAHELGHVLGLADAPTTGCPGRPMNTADMGHVGQGDCDGAMEAAVLANGAGGTSGGGGGEGGTGGEPFDDDPFNQDCDGGGCSPILVDIDRRGFDLSSPEWGVFFDVDGDGEPETVSWPEGGDGFLALDRNGNAAIDDGSELFGNFTEQPESDEPNGYHALAVFDHPSRGGNRDGIISEDDSIFGALRVWIDEDRDGETDKGELVSLEELGIEALSLRYWISGRRDRHGNHFRYSSVVRLRFGSTSSTDVFLATEASR